MTDFKTKADTCEAFLASIKHITLQTKNGTYSDGDVKEFFEEILVPVKQNFNELTSEGKKGLEELFSKTSNPINSIKSTSGARVKDIINKDQARYDKEKLAWTVGQPHPTPVITLSEGNEATDRDNNNISRVLGIKKALKEHIQNQAGTAATNSVILKANSNKEKELDDIDLEELKKATIACARRSTYNSTHELIVTVMMQQFDYRITVAQNMEIVLSQAKEMEAFGITFPKTMLASLILSNTERASKNGLWAVDFKDSLKAIRGKYPTTFVHDVNSIKFIMEEMATADENRNLSDAPPPEEMKDVEEANYVAHESYINTFLEESDTESEDELERAFAVNSDTESEDSSVDTKAARRDALKKKKKKKAAALKDKKKKEAAAIKKKKEATAPKKKGTVNRDCKHCKTHRRWAKHPNIPEKKCRFNPKAKVWRPKWVAELLDVEYKTRDLFTEENGGYPPLDESDASGSDSE